MNQKQIVRKQVKSVMPFAKGLQRSYTILNSNWTQNVRNPFPMHQLVVETLASRTTSTLTISALIEELNKKGFITNSKYVKDIVYKLKAIGIVDCKALSARSKSKIVSRGRKPNAFFLAA